MATNQRDFLDSTDLSLLEELQKDARLSFAELGRRVGLSSPAVAELARATPEVVECHRITGEDCYFMKAHVRSVEHLEEVIDRFTPYGQTTTSVMQSSPVPQRPLDLAQPPAS